MIKFKDGEIHGRQETLLVKQNRLCLSFFDYRNIVVLTAFDMKIVNEYIIDGPNWAVEEVESEEEE